jgi:hypothetical protein
MSLLFCCAFTPFQHERHGAKMAHSDKSSSILDERTKQEVVTEDWEGDSATRGASEVWLHATYFYLTHSANEIFNKLIRSFSQTQIYICYLHYERNIKTRNASFLIWTKR